ncbi:phytohormone-binding protein [Prunus yedoensis var. nudiflora]|uniref:Phytohormone-binding protein n=1 Tax=Prunus yedoensis var. nudiflora TaxID=2094558 RepID=A0A314Z311_PRUYE|nr:phytohormone-binding protein [Prunus yedoensis var. nudiflora]
MVKEIKTEAKVSVGIEALWKALAKDVASVTPKVIPNLVKNVEVTGGDGGIGTVFLFNFGSDVPKMSYQKEKIVELDEAVHKIGLQVIEGGHLNFGFSSYKTTFQLTPIQEEETMVSVEVTYESQVEDSSMPSKTAKSVLAFIRSIECYLLNDAI